MNKKFICLANSRRNNGRCIAGLLLDDKGNITNQWIRPIKKNNDSIPKQEVKKIDILSVVEAINIKEVPSCSWRPEDVYYDTLILENATKMASELIGLENNESELCDNMNYETEDSDDPSSVKNLKSSLALLKGTLKSIDENLKCEILIGSKKINNKTYTGFKTLEDLKSLINKECFFVISIGEQSFNNGTKNLHYKLIAEIIFL